MDALALPLVLIAALLGAGWLLSRLHAAAGGVPGERSGRQPPPPILLRLLLGPIYPLAIGLLDVLLAPALGLDARIDFRSLAWFGRYYALYLAAGVALLAANLALARRGARRDRPRLAALLPRGGLALMAALPLLAFGVVQLQYALNRYALGFPSYLVIIPLAAGALALVERAGRRSRR